MKKILIFISLAISNLTFSMQQVGLSQASQSLAAISPQLMQATRQYSQEPKKTFFTEFKKGYYKAQAEKAQAKLNFNLDIDTPTKLYKKYPQIKYISPIYSSSGRLSMPIMKFSPLNPLKEGSILYAKDYKNMDPKSFEGAILHELGHCNREFKFRLATYTELGLKISFIIGIFFKMIAIKYGILGYLIAPRLFWNFYMRFFEEPAADDFMIKHATQDVLKTKKEFFEKLIDLNPVFQSKIKNILVDSEHPTMQSRINKIQRAIDGHPNYNRIVRIALLFTITEETIRLLYNYSTDEASIRQGLAKLEEIENNFETYCDKLEIPAQGRPIYKNALETVKSYWLTKLYLIKLGRAAADIKEEEIIEIMTTPTETIIEESPIIKERWKRLFSGYE